MTLTEGIKHFKEKQRLSSLHGQTYIWLRELASFKRKQSKKQLIEVVYCKDCVKRDSKYCPKAYQLDEGFTTMRGKDWYCASGEAKKC